MTASKSPGTGEATPVETAIAAGQETVEKMMQAGREVMCMADIEKTVETAKQQADKMQTALFGGYDRIAALNQANFEAFAASVGIVAKGSEVIGREFVEYTRKSLKTSVDHSKAVMACKSVNEAFDRQGKIFCDSLDSALAETTRLSEMSVTTANEAMMPVRKRTNEVLSGMFGPATS